MKYLYLLVKKMKKGSTLSFRREKERGVSYESYIERMIIIIVDSEFRKIKINSYV